MNKLIADNFAGGGGASIGIEAALGRPIDIAINHDAEAIAMHLANHPMTKHFHQDIRLVDPKDACTFNGVVRPVALAWFSPDCKHHSKAKGGKPRDKNIRDLAWVVVKWPERLKDLGPDVIMLENVEEFRQWGPLDAEGKPIKERRGEEFDLWVRRIIRCGYEVEYRELVACHYGAPTSRKRLYLIARRDGQRIRWPLASHGAPDSPEVLSGQLKPYRTAAECIDWSIPCPSIFDRARDLKPNTMRRIAAGTMRYVVNAAKPFIVPVTNSGWNHERTWPADEPLRTVTTAKGGEYAAVDAGIVPLTHHGSPERGQASTDPMVTVTGAHRGELARVDAKVAPLFTRTAHGEQDKNGKKRGRGSHSVEETYPTVLASQDSALTEVALVPHVTKFRGGAIGADIAKPMPTVTANGNPARPAGAQPLALASATIVGVGGRRAQSPPLPVDGPYPTTTSKADAAVVAAMLSQFRGSNKGNGGDPTEPAKTVTAGGFHQAVVTAHMEQANGGPRPQKARSVERPLSTATSSGSQQRLVETTLLEEGDLPPELMEKAHRTAAFLIKYYGAAQHGQAVDEPMHSVTSLPRFAVVTVVIDATTYVLVDIGMRMLTPRELANAQGFPDDYILDPLGSSGRPLSKSAQIRMIGNSVCPDVAEAIVRANFPEVCEDRGQLAA